MLVDTVFAWVMSAMNFSSGVCAAAGAAAHAENATAAQAPAPADRNHVALCTFSLCPGRERCAATKYSVRLIPIATITVTS